MTRPSTTPARPPSHRLLALVALLGFVGALLGFGAALDGFSHEVHPVALLGARGVPRWWMFDLFGFVLPGLLAWFATVRMSIADRAMDAQARMSRMHGIGWTLCAFAALAFAAQGVLPVDVGRGFGYGVGKLHTAAWTVWWIAFVSGALLLAVGWRGRVALRFATALAAALVLAFAMFVAVPDAPALGQRIGILVWLVWLACVAWGVFDSRK